MSDDRQPESADAPVTPAHAGPDHEEPSAFKREVWGTRAGFILAAIGSAVGLGNMWRFPYRTAEGGGAAFVLLFILMMFLVGIPIMLAEFSIGRSTRLSPIGGLRKAGGKGWTPLGYLFVISGFLILAYYSVISGWATRYALSAILFGVPADPSAYFDGISTGMPAIGFHLLFMAIVIAIVMIGVEKGIERAALVMMPILFVLVIGLAIWAATLSGSGAGYSFYLSPSISDIFNLPTISAATGQAFFSLSLGMGAMLTFSSYLSRQESLPREATVIASSDFAVAFIAGLVVFPIIAALGLQAAVDESTAGTLFIVLPGAFEAMGGIGRVVASLFFLAIFVAALTSAISLLEVVTASVIDEWNVPRRVAAIGAGALIAIVGLWPATDLAALEAMDLVAAEVFLPVGALFMAILVGWRLKDPIGEVAKNVPERFHPWLTAWIWVLRVVVPIFLVVVLYYTIPNGWGAVRALF